MAKNNVNAPVEPDDALVAAARGLQSVEDNLFHGNFSFSQVFRLSVGIRSYLLGVPVQLRKEAGYRAIVASLKNTLVVVKERAPE